MVIYLSTYDEVERRGQQIELLRSRGVKMDKLYNEVSTAIRDTRTDLLGATSSGWNFDDDDMLDNQATSVDQIRIQKQRMMKGRLL